MSPYLEATRLGSRIITSSEIWAVLPKRLPHFKTSEESKAIFNDGIDFFLHIHFSVRIILSKWVLQPPHTQQLFHDFYGFVSKYLSWRRFTSTKGNTRNTDLR